MRDVIIEALDVSTTGTAALYAAMGAASEESDRDGEEENPSLEEQ